MSSKRIEFAGHAVPIRGNDIDTDQIIPARFLKEITFEKMGEYLFFDARFNEDGSTKNHILDNKDYSNVRFMIVEKNFGCGSSREHAPQAIMRFGIDVIIGESFSEIFSGNCRAMGVPTVTMEPERINTLLAVIEDNPKTHLNLNLETLSLRYNDTQVPVHLAPEKQKSFIRGTWDALGVLKENITLIKNKDTSLPY